MLRQLCEYQRRAVDFILSHSYCGICIAPELGKEIIGLNVIWQLLFDYFHQGKVLIVVEKGFVDRWKQELKTVVGFEQISCVAIHGKDAEKRNQLRKNGQIYFADSNTLVWIVQQGKWIFDTVIIDNLSGFRNVKAKHFQVLYKQRFAINRLIGFLPENHKLEELWAEWLLIDGGRGLGMHKEAFYERYFFRDRNKLEAKNDAKEAIYGVLSNTLYQVEQVEVSNVPSQIYKYLYTEMDAGEYSKYQWFAKGNSCCFELMQLANGMWCDNRGRGHCLHTKKVKEIAKIRTLHQERKMVVLYWFSKDALLIQENIKGAIMIKTYADVQDWQKGENCLGLVAVADDNIINILGKDVDVLVWFSLNETQDVYHRINKQILEERQRHRTWIYHLIMKGTVDEEMAGCYIG